MSAEDMPPPNLFIASLGNPGPLLGTRHSAAHVVLAALASHLGTSISNGAASVTRPDNARWTLFRSPSFMNESGPAVLKGYRSALRDMRDAKLVVLHDSLEHGLGKVVVREGAQGLSAKGHNGIKSLIAAVKAERGMAEDWVKVSVGIGRCESRDPEVVARWVLQRLTGEEREVLEGKSTAGVLKALEGIQ